MPIDVTVPNTPGWWMKRCFDKLQARQSRIAPLYARYEGDAPVPEALYDAPEAAQKFYRISRTNFAEMVVKALRYRLKVAWIQTARDSGETGDAAAWAAWRRAGMLVEGPDAMRNMFVAGDGYVLVSGTPEGPAATSEDPRQMVTIHDPMRQSRIRASAKFFHDADAGMDYGYLYVPERSVGGDGDGFRVFVAKNPRKSRGAVGPRFASSWNWDQDDDHGGEEGHALPNTDGLCPVVRYRNDEGVGDFERHTDLLDRVDHLILQGMVVATLQAFKQRAIKVDAKDMPDRDPETDELIDYNDIFSADPGALWKIPASAEMWESGAVDVTPISTMVTKQIEHVSAVMFTPMSMFTPEGANQSATGASLVKEGMTFKVEDKQDRIGASDAQVAALVFKIAGGELLEISDPETITMGWAPAERFSLAERADAAVKAKASGVPWRTIMRDVWQFGPEQVARMESERMSDAFLFPAEAEQQTARASDLATSADVDGA